MSSLELLIQKSTELLEKYDNARVLLEQESQELSKRLELETSDSIELLRKEIEVLNVDGTINLLKEETNKNLQALEERSSEIVVAIEEKLKNLDIDKIIADFNNQATQIIDEIKSQTNNGLLDFITISSKTIKCNFNSYCTSGSSTYSSFIKVDDNRFAIAKLLYNSTQRTTEATLTPFEIDVNGNIVNIKTPTQLFYNSSYGGISTTQFFSVDGTGKLFAYGNNAYPGQSSHKFGYFYGRVDENNNVTNVGSATNTSYHQSNGQYGGMLDSEGDGFYAQGSSYDQGDSKNRHIRIDYSGVTPNLSVINPSSDTSTGYSARIISQKGVSNPNIVGIIHYRTSSTSYYERAYNNSGSYTNYSINSWDSNMIAFVLSNGKVLNIGSGNSGYRAVVYNAYNQRTVLNEFELDPNYFYPYWSAGQITNVGKDTWLVYNYSSRILFSFHIDPDTYKITVIDSALVGISIGSSSQTFVKTAGANHEFLVIVPAMSSNYQFVKVVKNPLKMTLGE